MFILRFTENIPDQEKKNLDIFNIRSVFTCWSQQLNLCQSGVANMICFLIISKNFIMIKKI